MNEPQLVQVVTDPARAAILFDAQRLEILAGLNEPDSAAGLARRLGHPRQRVNYHLRQLEAQGFVREVGERRRGNFVERLVQAVARSWVISPAALGPLGADPADVTADRASSAYLVAVAARMIREVAVLREGAGRAGKKLATLTLQTDVRFASADAQRAFAEELTEAVARLAAKYHDEDAPGGRRFRVVAAAHPVPSKEVA